ncbi:BatD family protein [Colwellia piezophila]|uniref:BatD family protein n=1 Tax=Colwellia piezophila TaxID=211668 RepID=UPI00036183F2|nr:BatD family protein [Colwellia piezophila]
MNKKLISLFIFIVLFCQLTSIQKASAAQTIDDLIKKDKLSVSLQINQKEQQIVGQALILTVEVATDRWFATGSQIQAFTLPKSVMQANNINTINGTKRISGQTWATQTHEITLYPTGSGIYQVPSIKVDISVNTENDGIITGVASTQESSFTIDLPSALSGIENFIVSPEVTLEIEGQFDEEKDYAVGEAITQTITITAIDTPAMMIMPINRVAGKFTEGSLPEGNVPEVHSPEGKPNLAGISGLSIYHKPAQIFDKSNRGSLIGTRVESFTYIFEKPGRYKIDEQVIYWWNSQSNTLESLLIPSSVWTVSGGGLSQQGQHYLFNNYSLNIETIITLLMVLLLVMLGYFGFIKRHQLSSYYNKVTKREQRMLRNNFVNAIAKQNYLGATHYLYQYTLLSNNRTITDDCSLTVTLNQLAFNDSIAKKAGLTFSVNQAKALIKKIDTRAGKNEKSANFMPNERIKLNNE